MLRSVFVGIGLFVPQSANQPTDAASNRPLVAGIVALPETAGSALYGMVDVLGAAGTLWNELVGEAPGSRLIEPRIVSPCAEPFRCGNGIPVSPDHSLADDPHCDIVIVPEIWLAPTDTLAGRHDEAKAWIARRYAAGAAVYSACSGAFSGEVEIWYIISSGSFQGSSRTPASALRPQMFSSMLYGPFSPQGMSTPCWRRTASKALSGTRR